MTLKDLTVNQPTESALEILSRADRMTFANAQIQVGRYFGGELTADEVRSLTAKVELHKSTLETIAKL